MTISLRFTAVQRVGRSCLPSKNFANFFTPKRGKRTLLSLYNVLASPRPCYGDNSWGVRQFSQNTSPLYLLRERLHREPGMLDNVSRMRCFARSVALFRIRMAFRDGLHLPHRPRRRTVDLRSAPPLPLDSIVTTTDFICRQTDRGPNLAGRLTPETPPPEYFTGLLRRLGFQSPQGQVKITAHLG